MTNQIGSLGDGARIVLAGVRLVNGLMALLTPRTLLRRLGVNPAENAVAVYALRMFGVRTVLVAVGLLLPDGDVRRWSLRTAPLIHGSDVSAALMLARHGPLPRRSAIGVVLISLFNLALSIVARRRPS